MNHDSLVLAISSLFPGLNTVPPSGKVPIGQTSFWIPGLPRELGRVVRVRKSDSRLKKAASARSPGENDRESSIDEQFDGDLDALRLLVRKEIALIRESADGLGILFPVNLETGDREPNLKTELNATDDYGRAQIPQRGSEAKSVGASTVRDWTDEELIATVDCYKEMLSLAATGSSFVKAAYYRKLSERFGRVPGAFERRMQNISHLLSKRGLVRLPGLMPQGNIGANVEPRLLALMAPLFDEPQTINESTVRRLTRISYNSAGWRRPTGEAATQEHSNTYNSINGFGHEDWLFRNEWVIDDWRYAFIQGVSKSRKALVKTLQPVDLTLFTVDTRKRRRYVAHIREAEALDDQQADAAVNMFRQAGWLTTMEEEIAEVGGQPSALGNARWASHILNVRFKVQNIVHFPRESYALAGDPILQLSRYQLYKVAPSASAVNNSARHGSELPPNIRSYIRRGSDTREVTPEHAKMQAQLMSELRTEDPSARVVREQDYIDVLVETAERIFLYEIKSDLSSMSVLRQAIGQLLEYSHRMPNPMRKPVTLVAVGRSSLSESASSFLQHLQHTRGLPLAYRVVSV